ncbi:MAG TPA: efflux RND transporter permease subunit, partial [Acidobacteria bacterium]|nr:efflux RND transporter permease subunit [Acidobacteriota bacterium]
LDVTMMSMFGLVALSGVVVNDSLIMVDFINRKRRLHLDIATAVREAGVNRFRPILLTSLTTFVGLVPLMTSKSFDAAFMVPMAVSLAFGVLFATFITLMLVPTAYLILDDFQRTMRTLFGRPEPVDVEAPVAALPDASAVAEGTASARVAEA